MSAAYSDIKPERMMSTTQVAALFGVHRRTVLRWINRGIIRYWRPPGGRKYFVSMSAYQEFLDRFNTLTIEEQQALLASDSEDTDIVDDEGVTGE